MKKHSLHSAHPLAALTGKRVRETKRTILHLPSLVQNAVIRAYCELKWVHTTTIFRTAIGADGHSAHRVVRGANM